MPCQRFQGVFWGNLVFWSCVANCVAEGKPITIGVSENCPAIERLAASELQHLLTRLSQARVGIDEEPSVDTTVIYLGNPATNLKIPPDQWPTISDQGLVLKSVVIDGKPVLLVGGGSPVATLWSVYELGYRLGVRYLLGGDIYPKMPRSLDLSGLDVLMEPVIRKRTWQSTYGSPISSESWSLEDYQRFLLQLGKLKFTHLTLSIAPWQPFVHYECQGRKKQTALLWYGKQFPIPRDMPGRTALGKAKVFQNTDFAGKDSYPEMIAAGKEYVGGIIKSAQRIGITVNLSISPLEFPVEFSDLLLDAQPLPASKNLSIHPGRQKTLVEGPLQDLTKTKLDAYLDTYPDMGKLYLRMHDFTQWNSESREAWQSLMRSVDPDGTRLEVVEQCPPESMVTPTVTSRVLSQVTTGHLASRMPTDLERARNGISTRFGMLAELDPTMHFLARYSWDTQVTARSAHDDLFTTITGSQSVSDRLWLALGHIEKATELMEKSSRFAIPESGMLKADSQRVSVSEWWSTLKDHYTQAMTELYRSHDAAAPRSRGLLFYWAKRSEFVLEYLSCVESYHAAQTAIKEGNNSGAIEQLEIAVEQLYNSMDTLSDVVRNPGDRGLIALLHAYAYGGLVLEYENRLSEE